MRVVLLAPDFPPSTGGVQLVAANLAKSVKADGHDLTVVALGGESAENEAAGRVVRSPRLSGLGQKLNVVLYNLRALAVLVRRRPRAVLAAHIVAAPAAAFYCGLTRARFVVILHGQEISHRPGLARFAVRASTTAVAVSRHTKDLACEAGAAEERVVVVNPGVDAPERVDRSPADRPTIVTVARMVDRYKGHDVMLDAIELLRRDLPDLHWIVVGDGPLLEKFKLRVEEKALGDNVTFTGRVSDADRDLVLRSAHVFAMPSRIPAEGGGEGFGLVFLEAAAYGLPSLAGDEGGALDAVEHGRTGVLVDPRSCVVVADALRQLLTDVDATASMGRQARAGALVRDWGSFTRPVIELLDGGSTTKGAGAPSILALSHTGVCGGAERSLLLQLEQIAQDPKTAVALACPAGELTRRASDAGIRVIEITGFERSFRAKMIELPRAAFELFRAGRELASIARSEGALRIHANSTRAALVAAAARPYGIPPVVTHVRDCLPGGLRPRLTALLIREVSEVVVANSEFAASAYRRASSGGPVEVVYNPITAPTAAAAARGAVGFAPQHGPTLAVIGQITPWKGQDVAIRTLAAVRQEVPDARLLIAGSVKFGAGSRYENDRFEADLLALAEALGVSDAVEMLGEVDDVAALLEGVDIVMMPSWEEPFGRAALEAMAAGLPVVATSVGGPREFIEDGVNGLLATPGVVEEWAAAVRSLAGDRDLRAVMGARAARTAADGFAVGSAQTSIAFAHGNAA